MDLAVGRRILQLETLYDLLIALHGHRSEDELVEDLLQQVCSVLDPAAAAVVTRSGEGAARAVATVGWERSPTGAALLKDPLWVELLSQGHRLSRSDGDFAGRWCDGALLAP